MKSLLVVIAAAALSAGCSSSSNRSAATETPLASAAPTGLTGLGASRGEWDAAHRDADPDPKLAPGCCYGPAIAFFGQSSPQDTWYAVLDNHGVIYIFSHAFHPHTPEASAVAAIRSRDLPPDAHLISSRVGDGCKIFVYQSAKLAAAGLGRYASFDLVSPPDESVYYPNNIWSATVAATDDRKTDC